MLSISNNTFTTDATTTREAEKKSKPPEDSSVRDPFSYVSTEINASWTALSTVTPGT